MTAFNIVLLVAQCWLPGETEQDFLWAFQQLQQLIDRCGASPPSVIITDRDLGWMNALPRIFPEVPSMVCQWHMNRNVLAKPPVVLGQIPEENPASGRDKYENTTETDAFINLYFEAVNTTTETDFDESKNALKSECAILAAYLEAHW